MEIECERDAIIAKGRRPSVISQGMSGAYVYSRDAREITSNIAIDATLRRAAAQNHYIRGAKTALAVQRDDFQEKVKYRKAGATILFVVDASGSMRSRQRISEAKAAVIGLLMEAYKQRDRVGLITFRGIGAELILSPTSSVVMARNLLNDIPCGGKTPLGSGLSLALQTLKIERERDKDALLLMVMLSDGRANQSIHNDPVNEALSIARKIARSKIESAFLDTDEDWHEPGIGRKLCKHMNGQYFSLGQVKSTRIIRIVNGICLNKNKFR
ncbi:MAG: VWA domain-containing protein [Spirochaetota bacterium]|nr:VWA domain-containing protein [Spirochaetota bacterium]